MPRPRSDFAAVHGAARGIEPRLARAVQRALVKLREAIPLEALAAAIAAKDGRRALALIPKSTVSDALMPAGAIVRDTVIRGGRVGAEVVNRAKGRR